MPPRAARVDDGQRLGRAVEAFDRLAGDLVRLEPLPFAEVRRQIERFASTVDRHLERAARGPPSPPPADPGGLVRARLESEHERFRASVEQLRGLLDVVEADDHGGHRQALGQYGRVLAEALRLHLADEAVPAGSTGPGP